MFCGLPTQQLKQIQVGSPITHGCTSGIVGSRKQLYNILTLVAATQTSSSTVILPDY